MAVVKLEDCTEVIGSDSWLSCWANQEKDIKKEENRKDETNI